MAFHAEHLVIIIHLVMLFHLHDAVKTADGKYVPTWKHVAWVMVHIHITILGELGIVNNLLLGVISGTLLAVSLAGTLLATDRRALVAALEQFFTALRTRNNVAGYSAWQCTEASMLTSGIARICTWSTWLVA